MDFAYYAGAARGEERVELYDGLEPGAEGVLALARRALALRGGAAPKRFDGRRLAAVFMAPSLRTRTSLEAACGMLGVQPLISSPGAGSWALELREGAVMDGGAAEHLVDAVRVLARYADVLAVRHFASLTDREADAADPVLTAFAAHAGRPVINLESTRYHPLQGLADTATWLDRLGPDLRGVPLCLTWAPHPKALPLAVPHQVLLSAALVGMDVTVAHPEGFDLAPDVLARAGAVAAAAGGAVRVTGDRAAALGGARVVVAKSWSGWSGYGRREAESAARAGLSGWRVTEADMASTDGAGFMHCLPVRRNVVVDDAVLDGPSCWAFDEAELRLWTAAAALECILEGAWNA
jgi:N-acetylornithine carbamoyltransferase